MNSEMDFYKNIDLALSEFLGYNELWNEGLQNVCNYKLYLCMAIVFL